MSITELAANLVGEPWCLTPREIGHLTIGQVSALYFASRDAEGKLKIRDASAPPVRSPKLAFIEKWMKWGLSRLRAERKWEEEKPKKKAKNAAKRRKG